MQRVHGITLLRELDVVLFTFKHHHVVLGKVIRSVWLPRVYIYRSITMTTDRKLR
jgi:hypothetical protein